MRNFVGAVVNLNFIIGVHQVDAVVFTEVSNFGLSVFNIFGFVCQLVWKYSMSDKMYLLGWETYLIAKSHVSAVSSSEVLLPSALDLTADVPN